jgi:Protein of unknown function (DUF3626)
MPTSTQRWRSRVRRLRNTVYAARVGLAEVAQHRREADADVRAWVRGREVRIRVPRDILPMILDEGVVRTQFDTGTSRGAFSPADRVRTELSLFGISPIARPHERPTYGYLAGSYELAVRDYGSVVLRLQPAVRRRTTFTLGDSNDCTASGRVPNLSPCALVRPGLQALHARVDVRGCPDLAAATPKGYAEAQIHGIVTLADIAEVVFTDGYEPPASLRDKLRDRGMTMRCVQGVDPCV